MPTHPGTLTRSPRRRSRVPQGRAARLPAPAHSSSLPSPPPCCGRNKHKPVQTADCMALGILCVPLPEASCPPGLCQGRGAEAVAPSESRGQLPPRPLSRAWGGGCGSIRVLRNGPRRSRREQEPSPRDRTAGLRGEGRAGLHSCL
uniref:Uncharacterized protein n=1 Tax=Molossus molossus TaxID=27622 RepID=A0A7J8I8J1_MOLMO|nr:hypothetical protein HJG59_010497 [Molossus molossus]